MWAAFAHDAASLPELRVVTPLSESFARSAPTWIEPIVVPDAGPRFERWQDSCASCDAALVIAPESEGLLASATEALQPLVASWLGCEPPFLQAAADKWLTYRALSSAGIATPQTIPARFLLAGEGTPTGPWIAKPFDGCGSAEIFSGADGASCIQQLRTMNQSMLDRLIVQPRMPGRAVSVSAICGPRQVIWLPACEQELDGRNFAYLGGRGPLADDLQYRCEALAKKALQALGPGGHGWIGFDLLLGHAANGCEDMVIEINPRLTTSYVGLRHCLAGNLVAAILDVHGGEPATITKTDRRFQFTASGDVAYEDPTRRQPHLPSGVI